MLTLSSITVKDFRAFPLASFEIGRTGLVLVSGPNNAGKSALLSALDVVAGYETPAAVHHATGERARVWARFNLDEYDRVKLLSQLEVAETLSTRGAARWIEWEFAEVGEQMQAVTCTLAWPDTPGVVIARLAQNPNGQWDIFGPAMPFAMPEPVLRLMQQQPRPFPNALERFANTPAFASAQDLLPAWREGYFHFKPLRQTLTPSSPIDAVSRLETDGSNLASVLLYIATQQPYVWEQIQSLISELVPGVGMLSTPVERQEVQIAFIDRYRRRGVLHNIKNVGTGVEQLLMTLVAGLTQSARTVVLEEPETGLHPTAQRALLGLLQQWSEHKHFFASTHSSAMLDWTSPNSIVLSVKRSGADSNVTRVTSERADVLRSLGVRLSDVLSAERILIVEGPTDEAILRKWYPDVARNPLVALIPGGGGHNALNAGLLTTWLDHADALGGRKVLYLRDRDELPAHLLKRLDRSNSVYVLPCRELENLLLDFTALATVINRERNDDEHVTVENLKIKAHELAESLKQRVVMKRVAWELEPHRYVDNALRDQLTKQDADEARFIEAVVRLVPTHDEVKRRIAEAWKRNTDDVQASWDENWRDLVPGADLLSALWQEYLDRGYSKAADGLAIAAAMKEPPQELQSVLKDFMA